jgi:lipoprotein NlpD
MQVKSIGLTVTLCALMAACASGGARAPVEERGGARPTVSVKPAVKVAPAETAGDWRPQMVVVQKGDTLYGIAFNYGLDYRELAELNGIENPALIQVGQSIRLFPAENKSVALPAPVETKPLGEIVQPAHTGGDRIVKTQPKIVKLPYSDQALAQIARGEVATAAVTAPTAIPVLPTVPIPSVATKPAEVKPESQVVVASAPKPAVSKEGAAAQVKVSQPATGEDEALEWVLPTNGKLVAEFSESANRKGVDLAGKIGQPVIASAAGKVVYSGSGLRGYGKLIIIKHNKTYLSAYAHNDHILVKEGQAVEKGQKIAEMGNSDTDQPKLHFEIRRYGKPVDPAKFLPLSKS